MTLSLLLLLYVFDDKDEVVELGEILSVAARNLDREVCLVNADEDCFGSVFKNPKKVWVAARSVISSRYIKYGIFGNVSLYSQIPCNMVKRKLTRVSK